MFHGLCPGRKRVPFSPQDWLLRKPFLLNAPALFCFLPSAPFCGLHNVQNNKSAQSFQKSNRFLCHAPLLLQKKIRCNNPNRYFALSCQHQYAHCSQCQTCGHYAWDCKHHFSSSAVMPCQFHSALLSFSGVALLPVLLVSASGNIPSTK